jgi:hypothetical protein
VINRASILDSQLAGHHGRVALGASCIRTDPVTISRTDPVTANPAPTADPAIDAPNDTSLPPSPDAAAASRLATVPEPLAPPESEPEPESLPTPAPRPRLRRKTGWEIDDDLSYRILHPENATPFPEGMAEGFSSAWGHPELQPLETVQVSPQPPVGPESSTSIR